MLPWGFDVWTHPWMYLWTLCERERVCSLILFVFSLTQKKKKKQNLLILSWSVCIFISAEVWGSSSFYCTSVVVSYFDSFLKNWRMWRNCQQCLRGDCGSVDSTVGLHHQYQVRSHPRLMTKSVVYRADCMKYGPNHQLTKTPMLQLSTS